uniref:THH1/TOM1/TOM3 domain-containing protein n=1 Tax=Spongospora subterranea TaxID=70186 RepID=A0A0H5QV15_9EUKA|eukprot:CRZ05602.1 hypothetical protein [Spongospora subterranea]
MCLNAKESCHLCLENRPDIPLLDVWRFDQLKTLQNEKNIAVSVFPDFNTWEIIFPSWYYQLIVRWIPSIMSFHTFIVASIFLHGHYVVIVNRYLDHTPEMSRTRSRFRRFVMSRLGYPHLALSASMCHILLVGLILAIGGVYSTSNLPTSVSRFFITQNSGGQFIISIFSSAFWNSKVTELDKTRKYSLLTRFLRGDSRISTFIFCAVLVSFDIFSCSLGAMNYQTSYPGTTPAMVLTLALIEVILAVNFLWGAISFQLECRKVSSQAATNNTADRNGLEDVLKRLSLCAIAVSFFMLLQVIAFCCAATIITSPSSFIVIWSTVSINGIAKVALFVQMFRPKKDQREAVDAGRGLLTVIGSMRLLRSKQLSTFLPTVPSI